VQLPMMALAGVLILDGLRGPQVGPYEPRGVLPWIHWRGLLILSLLAAGNFFCMGVFVCRARTLARLAPRGRDWPQWLRTMAGVSLLVLFLWAYEAFSCGTALVTAWLAIVTSSWLRYRRPVRGAAFFAIRLPIRAVQLRAVGGMPLR